MRDREQAKGLPQRHGALRALLHYTRGRTPHCDICYNALVSHSVCNLVPLVWLSHLLSRFTARHWASHRKFDSHMDFMWSYVPRVWDSYTQQWPEDVPHLVPVSDGMYCVSSTTSGAKNPCQITNYQNVTISHSGMYRVTLFCTLFYTICYAV